MKTTTIAVWALAGMVLAGAGNVQAHCEIPCGIYDDNARLAMIMEHASTVEKSMTQIVALSIDPAVNANQLSRWVANKETHATEIQTIVTQYFMTQRIKAPAAGDKAAAAKYAAELGMLHKMLVHAMKAKQTTDASHVKALRDLVGEFGKSYMGVQVGTAPEKK
ncbi:MAG: nickel superoxide dismutase [Candidatus Promineifilaceae bacterium]|jgi:nickel superoxide dismutase